MTITVDAPSGVFNTADAGTTTASLPVRPTIPTATLAPGHLQRDAGAGTQASVRVGRLHPHFNGCAVGIKRRAHQRDLARDFYIARSLHGGGVSRLELHRP